MAASEGKALASVLQDAVPDEEEQHWSKDISFTENALAAVTYALLCAEDETPRTAAWAARQVLEAIDLDITDRLNIDPNAPGAEETITSDPAFQRELERQQQDLDALARHPKAGEWKRLRERSQTAAMNLLAA